MSAKSRTKLDTVRVMYTGITINMFHVQCDQNILNNQNTSMHLNIYSEILPVLVIHSRDLTHFVCVCWEGWGVARVRAANQSSLLSPPPLFSSCLSINQHHGYITAAKAPSYISLLHLQWPKTLKKEITHVCFHRS